MDDSNKTDHSPRFHYHLVLASLLACGPVTPTPMRAATATTAPACTIGQFLDTKCVARDGAYEIEGYVVAMSADEIVLSDGQESAPESGRFEYEGHVFVRPPPAVRVQLRSRARLRVTFDEVMFLGDPCCTPGPYIVHPAAR
jgi:hypothetical protein